MGCGGSAQRALEPEPPAAHAGITSTGLGAKEDARMKALLARVEEATATPPVRAHGFACAALLPASTPPAPARVRYRRTARFFRISYYGRLQPAGFGFVLFLPGRARPGKKVRPSSSGGTSGSQVLRPCVGVLVFFFSSREAGRMARSRVLSRVIQPGRPTTSASAAEGDGGARLRQTFERCMT